ncbi:hypothetical protein OUZ56_001359 [Daphnia magna]|uniref:Uncharacterized protein n=1 Tax=Daphnia magna TaxID=35525 RepID=A0ABR0A2F0_9CRUS|nr:hypothetical protein OUZ56_001359 [Daphnia magna]
MYVNNAPAVYKPDEPFALPTRRAASVAANLQLDVFFFLLFISLPNAQRPIDGYDHLTTTSFIFYCLVCVSGVSIGPRGQPQLSVHQSNVARRWATRDDGLMTSLSFI